MKKAFFIVSLCAALIGTSGTASAKLFNVEIDGQRVVVDFYDVSEQGWQYSGAGDQGWWPGLEPHSYDFKVWYPYLSDTFDMTLDEQLEWIEDLKYAGIDDWRIGYFWDTTPMKASLFGGLILGDVNLSTINTYSYFPPTACGPSRMEMISGFPYGCMTLGRTGNEDGAVTGAIINAMDLGFYPFPSPPSPPNERYLTDGEEAREGGLFPFPLFYTLPRSEAQDHWMGFYMQGAPYDTESNPVTIWYNDDLNYNGDDDTIGLMSPVDDVTGERPIGAWTLSESIPEIWPPNRKFHTINISDVDQPSGDLIPVKIVSVMQDEEADGKGRGNTVPDVMLDYSDEAAVVQVRAERDGKGNGRVYHITFTDDVRDYVLKIGVPTNQGKNTMLVDDGPNYDATPCTWNFFPSMNTPPNSRSLLSAILERKWPWCLSYLQVQ